MEKLSAIAEHLAKDLKALSNKNYDFHRLNNYAIVHHSNSIEGSSLTLEATTLLLQDHLTPNAKPLAHTFMAIDHYNALEFVLAAVKDKRTIDIGFIQEINARTMAHTGGKISAMAGDFDSSKGDLRKLTVQAGNRTFPNYEKLPTLLEKLCNDLNTLMHNNLSFEDCYNLAFDAHFQLVSIHPFADGNGRSSRLLMNYIQAYYDQPLSFINSSNKADYINALEESRNLEDIQIFRDFMFEQAIAYFREEIAFQKRGSVQNIKRKGGMSFLF